MAQIATFLHPLRFRLYLTFKPPITFCGRLKPVKTWMNRSVNNWVKSLQSHQFHFTPSTSTCCLPKCPTYVYTPKFRTSGFKYRIWSILGGSVVLGFVSFCSGIAYSMDGLHFWLDDNIRLGLTGASEFKEDPQSFLDFARKIVAALFLIASVFSNHPVEIAAKLTFILLSSKPSPSSVYFIIEQWRHQHMRQHPLRYKFKNFEMGATAHIANLPQVKHRNQPHISDT